MVGKGYKLYSVATMTCPRCHEGEVFFTKNPYKRMSAMHEFCPQCGLRYEKEAGFFFGAMYITYAFSVGLFVMLTILSTYLPDAYGTPIMVAYIAITLLLVPVYHRLSRIIWLNIFFKYEPELKDHHHLASA